MDRSRVTILLAAFLLPLLGLEARLVQLQLVDSGSYVGDLFTRKRSVLLVPAQRGPITDAKGQVLAEDRRAFDCYLVLEEYEKAPGALAGLLKMAPDELRAEIDQIYEKIEKLVKRRPPNESRRIYLRERRAPYLVRRDIPFEAALAIETGPDRYAGAVVRESLKRHYPFGSTGCHILGYLGKIIANEAEFRGLLQAGHFTEGMEGLIGHDGIAQLYRRGEFHGELIGRAGIERTLNDELRGRAGLVVLEREPGTAEKTTIELKPAEAGKGIELTLDIELQGQVEQILSGGLYAAAVVLDVSTGAVLAMASSRLFDPNDFVPPGNPAKIRAVLGDSEGKPLVSGAFARTFQLGSIFKVATAVAGLEERKVSPEATLPCTGRFLPNSRHFACWIWNRYQGVHGELALRQALERSCNCYFYEIGRRCEVSGVARWASALGIGAPTGLDLPGEAPGILPRRARSENDVLSLSIGQHELMVTPLQAAVMMAAIANGGNRVTPHVRRGGAPAPQPIGISPASLREIRQGLTDVVHGAHGTAHQTALRDLAVAGKTSSAQTREGQNSHAWFAGYAPHDSPRYVVAVFVEFGGHGGEAAAPLAARIFERLLR